MYRLLFTAGLKQHKGSLLGIGLLMFLISLSLGALLNIWFNAENYTQSELERAGFGALTVWVSDLSDGDSLTTQIQALPEVSAVNEQELIYANYSIAGQESDSEGQLITFLPEENRYRFFNEDLSAYRQDAPQIAAGEIYISPSLISLFGVQIGDDITFSIARGGKNAVFTVKGFYEDPFMGSARIGMKGFLICQQDHEKIAQLIEDAGIDALSRDGAMLHIFSDSTLTTAELNSVINTHTPLAEYTEFAHSVEAISGFMLVLQKAFMALLMAFILVLLAVLFVVLSHSLASTIEEDYVNMGILKTIGLSNEALRRIQLLQYTSSLLLGMILGLILSVPASRLASSLMLETTGLRMPSQLPFVWSALAFAAIFLLFIVFIVWKTAKIERISPMKAIRGETERKNFKRTRLPVLRGTHLSLSLAKRQIMLEKKKYLSACFIALLLVFFTAMIGRVDTWLGPDGKGMMDAFNPADHDLGVQTFGQLKAEEAEERVRAYSDITESYLLAMPGVAVNGIDYTANVIDQPERFHLLEGRTCTAADEIVVTEFVAADLGVGIGDVLTVAGNNGESTYMISGLYSCANDMGDNIGMSLEGYLKIGRDDPQIWCHHYFLADPSQKTIIMETLQSTYGGDIHIHENTWPGLAGIISAMQLLVVFMYTMVVLFILIVTLMTGSKLLLAEQRDMGIYKALGLTEQKLRLAFALRFGLTAALGAGLGIILSALLTDTLISNVMKLAGISNFASSLTVSTTLLPAATVIGVFTGFAYLAAGKIKKMDLAVLITE